MKTQNGPRILVAVVGLWLAQGCTCSDRTQQRLPRLELPTAEGSERVRVDFGTVQVNLVNEHTVRVRNGGAALLTVDQVTAPAPFGVKTVLPLTVAPGQEDTLVLTYQPTVANQRHQGQLTLGSDDPDRAQVTLDLAGQGIQAVAVVSPPALDFGAVYLGESGKVTLTLSNAGSNALTVADVRLEGGAAGGKVSGDLAAMKTQLPAGGSASLELTFSPTEALELEGAVVIVPDPIQGNPLTVPIQGRGVSARPELCFLFDGVGTAQCTDASAASPNLAIRFPALCDQQVYPPGSGASACAPGTSQSSGKLFLRNVGNVPVAYSAQYVSYPYGNAKERCDGGHPARSDFSFSNAPLLADGGQPAQFAEATTSLPQSAGDPKPWETAPITVTYRARSRCADEAGDQARVVWTRQGEPASRLPGTILVSFDGTSKLPRAVTSSWKCGGLGTPQAVPCQSAFIGVNNPGDAPLTVSKVEFFEERFLADGGNPDLAAPRGPHGGALKDCQLDPNGDCARFAWASVDGGDPNSYAPHILPATAPGAQPSQKVLGVLVFGPGGSLDCLNTSAACPGKVYRLYAKVTTDDPYAPAVYTELQGVAAAGQ